MPSTKTIADIGELIFIKQIATTFTAKLPRGITGIGDDAAVIKLNKNRSLLISTDLLVEKVHFLRDKIPPASLGYKAAAVNLSDIAAMGSTPKYVFLSIALPTDISATWLNKFLAGFKKLLHKYNVILLGGDTTCAESTIAINVTILGEAHPDKIKYRKNARPGDIICVTDNLGDSAAGLLCIKNAYQKSTAAKKLITRHYLPNCNIAAGQFLARKPEVHAMMDVSDGINSDLNRIIEGSKCGANIYLEALPISKELMNIAGKFKFNPQEMAAIGGEDYCLLVCIQASAFTKIARQFHRRFKKPLIKIGTITKTKELDYFLNGKLQHLKMQSYAHFVH